MLYKPHNGYIILCVVIYLSFHKGPRIEEAEEYSQEEVAYVKQGESALQEAIGILGEQDGWTTETIAVSTKKAPLSIATSGSSHNKGCNQYVFFLVMF